MGVVWAILLGGAMLSVFSYIHHKQNKVDVHHVCFNTCCDVCDNVDTCHSMYKCKRIDVCKYNCNGCDCIEPLYKCGVFTAKELSLEED